MHRSPEYPGISSWRVELYNGAPSRKQIAWDMRGTGNYDGRTSDRYLLHHSGELSVPLLHIHGKGKRSAKALLWVSTSGKANAGSWPAIMALAGPDRKVLSFDFRGQGEDRMQYHAASVDKSVPSDFDQFYANPFWGVLANYVYNSLLIGRPYLLQMIEDAEIVSRFVREKLQLNELSIDAPEEDQTLVSAIAGCIPALESNPRHSVGLPPWGMIVEQRRELWPLHYLLPGGAYVR